MKHHRNGLRLAFSAVVLMVISTGAFAQAIRTWVSGVGDDANPCSRTAPCKSYASAISKTAATGEISVLDPGDYGSVYINKSITISGDGTLAGTIDLGLQGIIINAGPTDVVIIRNLSLNGADREFFGPGLNGIEIHSAGVVHVENVNIARNTALPTNSGCMGNGICVVNSSGTIRLFVNNTTIEQNSPDRGSAGILIQPTGSGRVAAEIDNSRLLRNGSGLVVDSSGTNGVCVASIRNSEIAGNLYDGILAQGRFDGSGGVRIAVSNDFISDNGYAADALNQGGVRADQVGSVIRIYNNHITDNRFGVNTTNGGKIYSFGGNMISSNTTNGTFTGTLATQ